jgi:catalase
LSGAGYVTTDCKNLRLGEEPPFPIGYIDFVNNYLYPSLRKLQSQRDLPNGYRRTFHFPTTGCVNGTLTIRNDIPAGQRVGIFQPGKVWNVFLRFSGQDKETQNDTRGDAKGLAMKIFNVPGKKLLPGFEDDPNMDIVFNAFPVFIPQNETAFASLVQSRTELCGGGDRCRAPFGQRYAPNAAISAMEVANNTVSSQLCMPHYAISPYQFGKKPLPNPAVKYRVWPCTYIPSIGLPLPAGTPADYLTQDMITRLNTQDYCFDLQLQFQTDTCLHPINDFLTEWKESDTPFITFGRINIPKQTVLTDDDYICRHAAFNAWRVIEDHRPIGSLNRARLFDMMNSHNHRLAINNVQEPFTRRRYPGLQFWTPDELGINDQFKPATLKGGFSGNLLSPDVPAPPCPDTTCPPRNSAASVAISALLLAASLLLM